MDSLPLAVSRQFSGMEKRYLNSIKRKVSKAMNRACSIADEIPDTASKYIEGFQED